MTGGEIETLLYENVKDIIKADKESASPMVTPALTGKVYYRDMRPIQNEPTQASVEDTVVAVLAGKGNIEQNGSCVVNVYVPDLRIKSGMNVRDKRRTDMIEKWMDTIPQSLSQRSGLYFEKTSTILTIPNDNIKEHFVSLKMDFWIINA